MNAFHRWYCNSDRWAKRLQGEVLPSVLRGVDLGDDVLEIGPGPGLATDYLRERTARITSVEIDRKLAESLKQRLAGTNVTVVEADASEMPLPDASYSSALSFTMLHHVPKARQDRLLREACRVLKPGAPFVGTDSLPSLMWNIYHLLDDRNPVNPDTFGSRLAAAGFIDIDVNRAGSGFSWRARKRLATPTPSA